MELYSVSEFSVLLYWRTCIIITKESSKRHSAQLWILCYIREFQSNSNVLYLINCGNKSKSFLSFISFIVVSQHRVQVSCTCSSTSNSLPDAAYAAQYKLLSSFTNSFTAKAVPHMLSSVLTDVMQMLPSCS